MLLGFYGGGKNLLSTIVRGALYGVGGVTVVGGTALAAYTCTEQGLGLRREIRFWTKIGPVVFDYWYNASSTSPLVKYQKWQKQLRTSIVTKADTGNSDNLVKSRLNTIGNTTDDDDDDDDVENDDSPGDRKSLYKKLHERNAPQVFDVLLELGGLYIKLGQVLSVTALPVPKQYRDLFRSLQSNVPGHEEFSCVIQPTIERAFGKPLHDVYVSIDEVPVGAASIGQAHKAIMKRVDAETGKEALVDVIVKVQYPDAKWQVPADVQCVADFLKLCVFFGVVDESAASLSHQEFSKQFLAELDYEQERQYLQEVYDSSLDETAPYVRRGVLIPQVFPDLCTKEVITMTYLPGPKFEEEARKQLKLLGIDTDKGIRSILQETTKDVNNTKRTSSSVQQPQHELSSSVLKPNWTWALSFVERVGSFVGVDNLLLLVRLSRKIFLWSTIAAVKSINLASRLSSSQQLVPQSMLEWAEAHESAQSQADMLDWTKDAIDALFDVHGYQIFHQGLFNADAHPGNILIVQQPQDGKNKHSVVRPKLGLIDYGQCKRLTPTERQMVANLILSVANDESDDVIASRFRALGIKTKNDSTPFLASFAKLMFGPFLPQHLKHDWHRHLHQMDQVMYFPNELSMVYRASLLLRGLAMSFQLNVSVGELWRDHAQAAIDSFDSEKANVLTTCATTG
jgi:aarF domain-containing kinase